MMKSYENEKKRIRIVVGRSIYLIVRQVYPWRDRCTDFIYCIVYSRHELAKKISNDKITYSKVDFTWRKESRVSSIQ